jgi:hypothetical protein
MEEHMNDEDLDPRLGELVQGYHRPPEPPREELWARIVAARAASPHAGHSMLPHRGTRRFALPIGLAALLALAFGLGRLSVEPDRTPLAVTPPSGTSLAQQMATAEYLGRVEVFLTDFRAGVRTGRQDTVAPADARRLLAATRLMLDSPGGRDSRVRPLLEDLELVLAEIAQLPAEPNVGVDFITEGLDRRGTIARLRSAVPAGIVPAMQGES